MLDLKEKHVDTEVLGVINRAIIGDIKDSEGRSCRRYLDQGLKLLGRITSQVTNNGLVWEHYAELTEFQGSLVEDEAEAGNYRVKSCQFLQRACASASQKAGWDKEVEKCKDVLRLGNKYGLGIIIFRLI